MRNAHRNAIAKVMHQFVNFNLPSHRMLEYGNRIGLVWFSKYTLGILKPLMQTIAEKPFDALTSLVWAHSFDVPNIGESVPFVTKDVSYMFGTPWGNLWSSLDEYAYMQPFTN